MFAPLAYGPDVARATPPIVPVVVTYSGWTVRADPTQCTFDVDYSGLGTLMLGTRWHAGGQHPAPRSCRLRVAAPNGIEVAGGDASANLTLELLETELRISSASTAGSLITRVPAPAGRFQVRLIDPAGTPATWASTREIADSHGGSPTRIRYFLPRHHPDAMTFAIGPVSSNQLHSLFDRSTDTAVDFPDQALMAFSVTEPGMLEVTIPVSANAIVRILPDYFTHSLGVPYYAPFDDKQFPLAPVLWNSWTSYYEQVSEADIVRNTAWIAANLKPYGIQFVVVDDG